MADPRSRYAWSPTAHQYFEVRTGRWVSRRTIRRALDRALEREALLARGLSNEYLDKNITLAEWRMGMRSIIKNTHQYSAALAKGGWAQLTQADYGRIGQRVRYHYEKLSGFVVDLEEGLPLDGRYLQRAESYAQGSRSLYEQINRLEMADAGAVEERNILDDSLAEERHCLQCPELSNEGWVSLGTLPVPGQRLCRSQCYCEMSYRDADGHVLAEAA